MPHTLNQQHEAFANDLAAPAPTERLRHLEFCADIVVCLKPGTALELQLANSIAADYWRLNRIRGIEDGIFAAFRPEIEGTDSAALTAEQIEKVDAFAFVTKQPDLKFLSQYEMRIQRAVTRNKAELKKLQVERTVPAEAEPVVVAPPAVDPPVTELVPVIELVRGPHRAATAHDPVHVYPPADVPPMIQYDLAAA